ncbi:MAG: DNA topoisomerase III, partial [Planctomycetota bacterium]|nr:DNA topoisomerase III [Planctomycetota bacterium]
MLYIAEKPELARAVVEALGGGEKRRGYYECGADSVTWCFGHMLELCQPEDYDPAFKKWSLSVLPLFFTPWRKKPLAKSTEQFAVIVGLLREAECVVHAGDPDPEGQLLVDEILEYVKFTGTVKRVLINDNTPALVKKALANMRNNADFAGLSQSALAREL